MTKDEIQFWMLIAFAVTFILSSYKIYIMFNTPPEGIDTQTQHNQLEDIIINFLKDLDDINLDTNALFKLINSLDTLEDESYKNFNLNRLNQLLNQLYITYKVDSLNELIKRIKDAN
ncbi:MAG: hypothetical protein COA44_02330 [Arcobacter sp.]|nr:MAG: hypothetical protein COA44_02330 [Arcobacter sp.]